MKKLIVTVATVLATSMALAHNHDKMEGPKAKEKIVTLLLVKDVMHL